MLEKEIQKKIMKYLKTLDGGSFDVTTTGMYGSRGTADIIGVLKGCFVAIEVKQLKKKATPLQKNWLDNKRKCGAVCFVAHNVEEVEEVLRLEDLI